MARQGRCSWQREGRRKNGRTASGAWAGRLVAWSCACCPRGWLSASRSPRILASSKIASPLCGERAQEVFSHQEGMSVLRVPVLLVVRGSQFGREEHGVAQRTRVGSRMVAWRCLSLVICGVLNFTAVWWWLSRAAYTARPDAMPTSLSAQTPPGQPHSLALARHRRAAAGAETGPTA